MKTWRYHLTLCLFSFMLVGFALPTEAKAYCIANQTNTALHVQALDAPGFEADIKAGDQTCCDQTSCLNRKGTGATVLAVTGYVPVQGSGSPGWKAECRASVAAKGTLTVTGTTDTISCQTR